MIGAGNDVIIVTMNYRLGAFGFLPSEELEKEGGLNAGVLDVAAAFKWVRKYIHEFGGNPRQVTAWGLSSGAMIISCLLVAKDGSMDLFDRAIVHSGSILPVLDTPKTVPWLLEGILTKSKCTGSDHLQCLRKLSAAELLKVSYANDAEMSPPITSFFPLIDSTFLTRQNSQALAQGLFRKVPLMLCLLLF